MVLFNVSFQKKPNYINKSKRFTPPNFIVVGSVVNLIEVPLLWEKVEIYDKSDVAGERVTNSVRVLTMSGAQEKSMESNRARKPECWMRNTPSLSYRAQRMPNC